MKENTAEKFFILIQHPDKSRFIVSEQTKNAGLIGSILLDLANAKNLEIESGKLIVKSTNTDLSQTHKTILEQIEKSTRIRKIKTWISKFSRKSRKYQKEILLGLDNKGIIKIDHRSFLGIKYYKTQLTNSAIRESIINEIRDIIFKDSKISEENSLIIGLVEACKMHKIIANDKSEIRICKRKLAEIIKSDSIAQGVDKVIKEMQAAIIGAVVASTVAATASSN
jgi:Golgi phosphoprotein 3